MARGEQILRHWNLLRTLQTRGQGMTLRDFADECEVSQLTLQRDFEALQEAVFPLEFQENEHGKRCWRLPHDVFKAGPLVLSLTETLSLHQAEQLFDPLASTLFTGPAALLVEERGSHDSQRVEWLASEHTLFEALDGDRRALQATFELADLIEFKHRIKSYGGDTEVLRPEALRRELRDAWLAAIELYDARAGP
jgi:predicted DNA-binding transcriptional regulator YafY